MKRDKLPQALVRRHEVSYDGRVEVPEKLQLRTNSKSLLDHFMDDVVFVSVDIEGMANFLDEPGIVYPVSVGISTLDTRHLKTGRADIITTQNLCFMHSSNFTHNNRHFLFGESELLPFVTTKEAIRTKLSDCLFQPDPQAPGELRKAILLAFDARVEVLVMEHLGLDLLNQPSFGGILDPSKEMTRLFGDPPRKALYSLGKMRRDVWSFEDGAKWGFEESLNRCKCSYGNLQ